MSLRIKALRVVNYNHQIYKHSVEGLLIEVFTVQLMILVKDFKDGFKNFRHKFVFVKVLCFQQDNYQLYKALDISVIKSIIRSGFASTVVKGFIDTCNNHFFQKILSQLIILTNTKFLKVILWINDILILIKYLQALRIS